VINGKKLLIVHLEMKSLYQIYEIVNTLANFLGVHESYTVEVHNTHILYCKLTLKGFITLIFFGVEVFELFQRNGEF